MLSGNVGTISCISALELAAGVSVGLTTDRLVLNIDDAIEVDTEDLEAELKNLSIFTHHSLDIQTNSPDGVRIEDITIKANEIEAPRVSSTFGIVSDKLVVGQESLATSYELTVNGTAGKTGSIYWSVFSDARLKSNINTMTGSLDTIDALRPVTFNYSDKQHFSYIEGTLPGFIAQEVQQVIPQWVEQADDGYLYLNPVGYEAMIVDAIQELRAEKDHEIQQLQLQNAQLQARLDRLELMVLKMEN